MFWKRKKKEVTPAGGRPGDTERVQQIRERLADYVSSGEKTNFDIPSSDLNEDGTYEFNVTDIGRVNYDVTEWEDLTEADTDIRAALNKLEDPDGTSTVDHVTPDVDYWKNAK